MNKERLIFHSPELASDFTRTVENRIEQERKMGVSNNREIVSQELAKKFEAEGHGVSLLATPWEHSDSEHVEAQALVDVAFHSSLTAAIAQAEKSPSFPRNMDLFHDVLTGQMYDAIVGARINTQHIPYWIIVMIAVFFALLLGVILVFSFSI
ncbi:MAG TPA: hypothetical protein VJI96_05330 [Candidatus Andersenbacteria bacterium]|nr:hypothetical protein [Candidatus Andersenbacteria bacterium]